MGSEIRCLVEAVHKQQSLTYDQQVLLANEVMRLNDKQWQLRIELDVLARFIRNAKVTREIKYSKGSLVDNIVRNRVL